MTTDPKYTPFRSVTKALLELDHGCIIGEDKDHIVLAISIPKEVLRRNHALLAAISDAIGKS